MLLLAILVLVHAISIKLGNDRNIAATIGITVHPSLDAKTTVVRSLCIHIHIYIYMYTYTYTYIYIYIYIYN